MVVAVLPTLGFERPVYLWLLIGLVPLAIIGWRPLAVLGSGRRILATLLRTAVWTAIVLALSGVRIVRTDDRTTVMYVLDQSDSIPAERRDAMLEYVRGDVRRYRNVERDDQAGVIVFGRDAAIEIPPLDDDVPAIRRLEGVDARDATNLEDALDLALASMPEGTARRVVVITDGNENLGGARRAATRLTDAGVGIDVVPVPIDAAAEVLVEKVDLPAEIRKGTPFEARVVVQTYAPEAAEDRDGDPSVRGRLRMKQIVDGEESLLLEQSIELPPGKTVLPVRHTIDRPAAYEYVAEFIPDAIDGDARPDAIRQNNTASAFTYVRGSGRVLLIVPEGQSDQWRPLTETLRGADIEVTPMETDALFGSLAELRPYDAVILGGVPRVADSAAGTVSFDDAQIDMLVENTRQLGAGLMMIGSPESFGAGGWTGTEMEKAMPVDFQIRNRKVQAVGALAIIMHASEMARGNYWQKVIGKAAIEQLGPSDYAGVLHWTMSGDAWLWGGTKGLLPVGPNRKAMLAAMNRMTPGDMPQFDPAMKMAVAGLARTDASVKHCIIISDGDPSPPANATIAAFKDKNITISTVAVASHGLSESKRLQQIATATGGKYYAVKSGAALPRIFQREARRVSRSLILDIPQGAAPQIVFPHPVLEGIAETLPPITGLVQTQTKDSSLAQILVRSPIPKDAENSTVLAVWSYGLGRAAALTTDAGNRWAQSWIASPVYEKLFSQLVRWLMRPTGDTGKFTIASNYRDGRVEVVVDALSVDDGFVDFLDLQTSVIGPDLRPVPLELRQTASGRYVGSFDADRSGNYFVNVIPGGDAAPLATGVTVPYSAEYRERSSDFGLIRTLAATVPAGGAPGVVRPPLTRTSAAPDSDNADAATIDPFRSDLPPARDIRDVWPWVLLLACGLFLADIAVRRIAPPTDRLVAFLNRLRRKKTAPVEPARLDQLREAKRRAADETSAAKAGARFDPTTAPDPKPATPTGEEEPAVAPEKPAAEETSYTSRLLDAKRRSTK